MQQLRLDFWEPQIYNILMGTKSKGGAIVSPRTGRPTDCKKDAEVKVRVPSELNEQLIKYSEEHHQTKAETVRQAINAFLPENTKEK